MELLPSPWIVFFCGQESRVMSSTAGCHGVTDCGGNSFGINFPPLLEHFSPALLTLEVPELGRCDDFPLQRLSAIHFRPFVRWRFVNCVNSLIATSACDKDLGSRVQALPGLIAARKMFCQNHQCLSKAGGGGTDHPCREGTF